MPRGAGLFPERASGGTREAGGHPLCERKATCAARGGVVPGASIGRDPRSGRAPALRAKGDLCREGRGCSRSEHREGPAKREGTRSASERRPVPRGAGLFPERASGGTREAGGHPFCERKATCAARGGVVPGASIGRDPRSGRAPALRAKGDLCREGRGCSRSEHREGPAKREGTRSASERRPVPRGAGLFPERASGGTREAGGHPLCERKATCAARGGVVPGASIGRDPRSGRAPVLRAKGTTPPRPHKSHRERKLSTAPSTAWGELHRCYSQGLTTLLTTSDQDKRISGGTKATTTINSTTSADSRMICRVRCSRRFVLT